jgi:diaminopimelate epimerase
MLSDTLDGERQRTLTLSVLDDHSRYTLSCGSAAATFARWRSDCDRALRSFHVVHAGANPTVP